MPASFPQSNLKRSPLLAFVGAVVMAVCLFLVIPLTQSIQGVPAAVLDYREVVTLPPPPDPPVLEEEPPAQRAEEALAEFEQEPPTMELSQLEVSLNPGIGEALSMGVQSMRFDVDLDVVAAIQDVFDFDELAQPPSLVNARQIRLKFPPELARRGVKEVKVVVEILIDREGRTKPVRVISSSVPHPKVDQEALRAVRQARFTVTKVDGRAVQVRARFPLTLRAPR